MPEYTNKKGVTRNVSEKQLAAYQKLATKGPRPDKRTIFSRKTKLVAKRHVFPAKKFEYTSKSGKKSMKTQKQIDAYNKKKVRKIVTGSKRKSNPVSVKKNIKRRVK